MKILYYTSTGNNLYIAQQLGGELYSIPQMMKNNHYTIEDEAVGLIFPVFFATSPKSIREFIQKVNINADYFFIITSYGAGGHQNALNIMKRTFDERGIHVNYTNAVLMVDNFLPLFDMAEEKKIKKQSDIDEQINTIKDDITNRKDQFYYDESINDQPNIEVMLETTMTERFHIMVGEDCSNCRICTQVCPRGNIELIDDKPVIGDDCDFCLGCVQHCKTRTLTINDESNPDERFRNPHIKVSQIIKSNNQVKK